MSKQSHIRTPLLFSPLLSQGLKGHNVYLKLESLQPSGSFKIRGVGRSVQSALSNNKSNSDKLHVISSSGGNAGLAASTAARIARVRCTVYCPETTPDHLVELFKAEGATVIRRGKVWDEANALALAAVADDPANAVLVHPFEGEELVRGNATIMDEVYDQLRTEHNLVPENDLDVVCCVVGGGGLINGVLTGILNQEGKHERSTSLTPFRRPTVLATQCFGADAFSQSLQRSELITLPDITSRATSMGAKTCSPAALETSRMYGRDLINTLVVDDALAARCSYQFAQDHLILIELSCGAALVPVYYPHRLQEILSDSPSGAEGAKERKKNIVIVVCGGRKDQVRDIFGYRDEVTTSGKERKMEFNGRPV